MNVTDPQDPRIQRGIDEKPRPQNEAYLVLSEEERAKGFVRPVRDTYEHTSCTSPFTVPVTTMGQALAETWARDPKFYSGTYCVHCGMHRPVGEFVWYGTDEVLGSDVAGAPEFT